MSDIAADVTLKDNSAEVKRILKSAVERGLKAIGMAAEGHAKRKIQQANRIDTGLMLNSITYAISGEKAAIEEYEANKADDSGETKKGEYKGTAPDDKIPAVYVGTNVEYAKWHEVGTGKGSSTGQGRSGSWGYTDERTGESKYTSGVSAIHFLKDAATKHSDEYKALMKDSLENA